MAGKNEIKASVRLEGGSTFKKDITDVNNGAEFIRYSDKVSKLLHKENDRRQVMRDKLEQIALSHPETVNDVCFIIRCELCVIISSPQRITGDVEKTAS